MKRPAGEDRRALGPGMLRAGAMRRCGGRPGAGLRREDRDGQIHQQWQAEAKQRQRHKGDARPQDVDAELVGHAGADAEDHAIATILAKTLFHFFPFCPGLRGRRFGGEGRPVR